MSTQPSKSASKAYVIHCHKYAKSTSKKQDNLSVLFFS